MGKTPTEVHPGRALARLAAGTASPAERRRAMRHLLGGCEPCGRRLARRLRAASTDGAFAEVVARAAARVPELERQVAAEQRAAAAVLARLEHQPPERQRLFLANAAAAHRRAVCELLLERAHEQRHRSARETLRFAELALVVAERVDGPDAAELRARAWAELGNARRIVADLAGAAQAFTEAERLVGDGCADPLFRAELWSLRASLAHHQRQFYEAAEYLRRSVAFYESCSWTAGTAKTLIKLGLVAGSCGEPKEGIPPLLKALDLADAIGDTTLVRLAVQNLIHLVAEAGYPLRASALVARARPLFDRTKERLDRLRFDWVAARIDSALGLLRAATAQLELLRDDYAAEGLPFEAALVALDIAAIYARDGRHQELKTLAAESCELFGRIGVGREHLASLAVLAHVDLRDALVRIAELTKAVEGAWRSSPSTATTYH